MKVLVLCSTTGGGITPFVKEQVESCAKECGINFEYAEIKNKGAIGYMKGYFAFLKKLVSDKYDLVHAHYGLSALLACLQPFKPAVVTFHGCDVNDPKTRWVSKLAYRLCKHAIFVEAEMPGKLKATKKYSVIPCGVNTELFQPMPMADARKQLNLLPDQQLALFASAFDVPVKNAALAQKACQHIEGLRLIELKNKTREEVNLLLNACNVLLLTSNREGSPQIIKEALATNCPVVSTNVGDVEMRLQGIDNTYVCEATESDLTEKLKLVLKNPNRSNGRERVFDHQLDLRSVAKQICKIYSSIKH